MSFLPFASHGDGAKVEFIIIVEFIIMVDKTDERLQFSATSDTIKINPKTTN